MSNPNIGLLLCDDIEAADQADYGTYTQMFENALEADEHGWAITPLRCFEGQSLPDPNDFDGYIISGSRCSVYDDIPWIHNLMGFVRECWNRDSKVVGICFGHQLIAHALGGEARKADAGWGFGIHRSAITGHRPWMDNSADMPADHYNLIVIHQDQVVTVPKGFDTLATSDFCPNSLIVADGKMLGIQGHPEFSKAFCKFRADHRRELIGEDVYQSALDSLASKNTHAKGVMGWVRRFLSADQF